MEYTDQLKLRQPHVGMTDWGDEVNGNTEIMDSLMQTALAGLRVVSGCGVTHDTALDVDVSAGSIEKADGTILAISAGSLTLADDATVFVYVTSSGALAYSTSQPPAGSTLLAVVDTVSGDVIRIGDARWMRTRRNVEPGYFQRAIFENHPTDGGKIRITSGFYEIAGVGVVYNPGVIDYTLTSLSDGVWSYIFIDASTITTSLVLTAANLFDSNTAWAFDSQKGGQYSGDDRGIFAVRGTGATTYCGFHSQRGLMQFESPITVRTSAALTTGWVDQTAPVPVGTKFIDTWQALSGTTGACNAYFRRNGTGGTGLSNPMRVAATGNISRGPRQIAVDSSGIYEVKGSNTNGSLVSELIGFRLPSRI